MLDDQIKMSEFIADISSNIILKLAKSGKVLFVNSKAKCVFSQIKTDDNIKDFISCNDMIFFEKNIQIALYNQHPHNFYFEYKQRFYIVYLYPEDASVWLSFEDISEKRQLSHLLQISSLRTDFCEKRCKSGYWELDLIKKRFYWSLGVYKLFEINEEFTNNKKNLIKDLIIPQDLFIYKNALKKLLLDKEDVNGFVRILSKNNKIKKCRFSAGVFYENGEEKIAGVFVDVSDCKDEYCENCNYLLKDYSCMMAKIVHDIRQPVNVIKLWSEKVKKCLKNNDKGLADNIINSCDNLSYMLEGVLNFAKNNEIKYEKFNLRSVVEKVYNDYSEIIKNKKIKIILQINDFEIFQSIFWVEKIIRNLLDNAIKYTDNKIIIKNIRSCLYIADNGCGINKKYRNHIFKDFFQCKTLIQNNSNGVGLGLSIVEHAVSLIGAKIKFKSREKCYTIFKVCL